MLCAGSYSISGGGALHAYATNGGIIDYGAATITATVTANVTFSNATIKLAGLAVAHIDSTKVTWSLGVYTVTGKRYALSGLSVLDLNSGGGSYIPGTIAGTTADSSILT